MSLPNCIGRGMSEQERDAFGNWLAGFVDGEGSFILKWVKKDDGFIHCSTIFTIQLRRDDAHILKEIRDFFGCGYLTFHEPRKNTKTKPSARLWISRSLDLEGRVVPVFERYILRAKKRRDFDVWKEAIKIAARVRRRKFIRDSRGRVHSKWATEEIDFFKHRCEVLRTVRKFDSNYNVKGFKDSKKRKKIDHIKYGFFTDEHSCF